MSKLQGADVHPLNKTRYTAALVAPPEGEVTGSGYALLSVNAVGQVAVSGKTADGVAFTQSVRLIPGEEAPGTWALPMFAQLYPKAIGLLAGNAGIAGTGGADLSGKVDWYRPAVVPGSNILGGRGYYGELEVAGGRYAPPAKGISYLSGNATTAAFSLLLEGGAYAEPVEQAGQWPASNAPKLNSAPKGWTFSYTAASGLLRGTAPATIGEKAGTAGIEGVVLPEGVLPGLRGAGYTITPSQIGKFEMKAGE